MRRDALPLPVGTPFGIDIGAVERVGAFTPGHQIAQQFLDALTLTIAEIVALCADAVQQVEPLRLQQRQMLN